jgi:hypothetical protein
MAVRYPRASEMDGPNENCLRLIVEEALRVAKERKELLEQVADALSSDDEDRAIALMKRYCGMRRRLEVTR